MDLVDCKFKTPSNLIVSGPTGSGKTRLVMKILDPKNHNALFGQTLEKIYFIYSIWQDNYVELGKLNPNVKFIDSFKKVDKSAGQVPTIVVWDDCFLKFQTDKNAKREILDVFYRLSHHRNIFNIVIFQALTQHGLRNAWLNSQYHILFPIKNDLSLLKHFSRQMFPTANSSFLVSAMQDATKTKYGYLFIDKHPSQEPELAVRNFVIPSVGGKYYFPEGGKNGEATRKRRVSKKLYKSKESSGEEDYFESD